MPFSSTVGRRLAIAGLCVLCLVACCGLAWWQWSRFTSGGSFQNLGYVLQWPLFGVFPLFMVWRYRTLQRREATRGTGGPAPFAPSAVSQAGVDAGVDAVPDASDHQSVPANSSAPAPRWTARPTRSAPLRRRAGPHDHEDPQDEVLDAYNRYLAELNARDQEVK